MYTAEYRKQLNADRISTLVPELRSPCLEGIDKLEQAGYEPLVVEARRSQEYQDALYAQGRQSLDEVNLLRQIADKDPISEQENTYTVTQTKNSKHLSGKAFDVTSVNKGVVDWDDYNFINMAGIIFKKLGLVWGGDWLHKDDDHFELP